MGNRGRGFVSAVLAGALVAGLLPAAAFGMLATAVLERAEAATSGTWLGLSYDIDDTGALTFHAGTLAYSGDGEGLPSTNSFSDTAAFAGVRSVRADGTVVLTGDASGLFYGASSLRSVDLSNFDFSQVTSMGRMFDGCTRLASVDFTGIDTSKVEDMSYLFYYCGKLQSVDITGFDTSSLTSCEFMFGNCEKLAKLEIPRFYTSKVDTMREMFEDCAALETLDISGFETGNVSDMHYLFEGCDALASVKLGTGFNFSGSGSARQCSFPTGSWKSSSDGLVYRASEIPSGVGATYTYVPSAAATMLAAKKSVPLVEKMGGKTVTLTVKATKVSKKARTAYVSLRKVVAGKRALSALAVGKAYRKKAKNLPAIVSVPEPRWHPGLRYTIVYVQVARKAFWKARGVKTVRLASTVEGIGKSAFGKSSVRKLQVRTRKLVKKRVRGCFRKSKMKTVTVSVGSRKKNRKFKTKYKKDFAKKNSGRTVKVA